MSEPRPVASCVCGYALLPGQTCPECGRPFNDASTYHRPSAGCLPLAGVVGLLGVSGFGLLCAVEIMYNSPEAGLMVFLQVMGMWLAALVLIGIGVFAPLLLALLRRGHAARQVLLSAALVGVLVWAGLFLWSILSLA